MIALAVAASLTACGGSDKSNSSSSKGPKVPDLVGKSWSDATDQLSLEGTPYISKVKPGSNPQPGMTEDKFEVCSTQPKAGEPVGTDITMEIAPTGKC